MPTLTEDFLQNLKEDYTQYNVFIETGTCHGGTLFRMEPLFDELYTIELEPNLYQSTKSRYKGNKINFYLGDSSVVLEQIIKNIKQKSIFFLDGHWASNGTAKGDKDCPLMEEISSINEHFPYEAIIIVDDCRLMGKGPNKGNYNEDWEDISIENLKFIIKDRITSSYMMDADNLKDDRLILHIEKKTEVPDKDMTTFLKKNHIDMNDNGTIKIKDSIKHIKLDVGVSHLAPHTRHWLKTEKDLMVFSFEPRLDCVKLLRDSNIEGSVVVPCALSDVKTPELMNFNVTKNLNDNDGGASSLFNLTDDFSKNQLIKEIITVPVFNLKMFLELIPWGTNGIEYIDYLKIDAQGADINVIKGAGDIIKDRVVYITAEPDGSSYVNANNNNVKNLVEYMQSMGFIYVTHPNTKDPTFLNEKFVHLKDSVYIFQKDWWLKIGPNGQGNGSNLIGKSDIPYDLLFYK